MLITILVVGTLFGLWTLCEGIMVFIWGLWHTLFDRN